MLFYNHFLVCWAQACTLHLFLAIERCVAQIWPQLAKSLFDGPRIWPWLLFSLLYSLYYGFLWKPAVLSSAIGTTSPDPFSGYRMADEARKGIKVRNLIDTDIGIDNNNTVNIVLIPMGNYFLHLLGGGY